MAPSKTVTMRILRVILALALLAPAASAVRDETSLERPLEPVVPVLEASSAKAALGAVDGVSSEAADQIERSAMVENVASIEEREENRDESSLLWSHVPPMTVQVEEPVDIPNLPTPPWGVVGRGQAVDNAPRQAEARLAAASFGSVAHSGKASPWSQAPAAAGGGSLEKGADRARSSASGLDARLIATLSIATPAIAFFLGLIATLAVVTLFSRLRAADLMKHERRRAIAEVLATSPGLSIQALARAVGIPRASARYHVERLSQAGLVSRKGPPGRERCFVPGQQVDPAVAAATSTPVARRVLGAVRQEPGSTLANVAQVARTSRQLALYHLNRMEKIGLVSASGAGRARVYSPRAESSG